MNVAQLMSRSPVTVSPDSSVPDAALLMRQRGIRRLPVLEDGRLVGIVTDRDLREVMPGRTTTLSMWEATTRLAALTVGEVMRRGVVTTHPEADTRDAAYALLRHKIGGMPVVDDAGMLVGMLTVTDLLHDYARMPEPGTDTPAVSEEARA
ncbi:CBS domain-containing protein [Deinococcus planocerae]|uniref:CBS domain-containing protein n=1 Tax=Deinococcus planocerae TaxID=1737569 RepID=UPI001C642F77|nr:CBS domain-containing protein [Deinococcus planocerae]